MKITAKELAYALLRIGFGVNFLGHGLFRILSGTAKFATTMAGGMTKSLLPHGLIVVFGNCIPWLETVLGLMLILGLGTRLALVAGALFMWTLTFGVTSNQQWDVAGQQLLYSLVFFVLLFMVEYNALTVDRLFRRRKTVGFVAGT
jgi:thiosulfate dehydrogenase [quinone] large subunit